MQRRAGYRSCLNNYKNWIQLIGGGTLLRSCSGGDRSPWIAFTEPRRRGTRTSNRGHSQAQIEDTHVLRSAEDTETLKSFSFGTGLECLTTYGPMVQWYGWRRAAWRSHEICLDRIRESSVCFKTCSEWLRMKGELKNVNMSQIIILDVSIDTWTVGDVSAPRAGGG